MITLLTQLIDLVFLAVALMKAALNCNQEAIDYLINHTALGQKKHIHAKDKTGGNLLHFACCEGELSFIQYLVDTYDLDINA